MKAALFVSVILSTALESGRSQSTTVRGITVDPETMAPIRDARVISIRAGESKRTDRFGRFSIGVSVPDTLVVRAIGRQAKIVVVESLPSEPLTITLSATPVDLGRMVVDGRDDDGPAQIQGGGGSIVSIDLIRALPQGIEPDLFRSLSLVPGVSFSSPLSARASVRGYSADDVATRIDGFEALNLYRLGRVFSSFPADAADRIAVTPGPVGPEIGSATGGVVDIDGRSGPRDRPRGGASWSFGSLTGWAGGSAGSLQGFTAVRAFYWEAFEILPNVSIPYRFADLYGQLTVGKPARPRARLTTFLTRDRADGDGKYLHWSNLLVGGEVLVLQSRRVDIRSSASLSRAIQIGLGVPGLHSTTEANLDNVFRRIAARTDLTLKIGPLDLTTGLEIAARAIGNRIQDAALIRSVSPLPQTDTRVRSFETTASASVVGAVGQLGFELAVRSRFERSRSFLDPLVRARLPHRLWVVGCAAGRSSRAHHLLSEPRSEPDFDFLDFWLETSDTVPAASVDHLSCDLTTRGSLVTVKLSAYASMGRGIGELRPSFDQSSGAGRYVRFGRSRTQGLELQLGFPNRPASPLSGLLSYAWASSRRNWGDGWRPWILDRRHQARGMIMARTGRSSLSVTADAATGIPITPIDYHLDPRLPYLPIGSRPGRPEAVPYYGAEQSMETSGTFRLDAGWQLDLHRGRRRKVQLGVAVINVLMTATAPFGYLDENGTGPLAVDQNGRPLPYRREFTLPMVPSLTARIEF